MAQAGCIGSAFLLANSYVDNPNLTSLTRIDQATVDFWNTFSTLRFSPVIYCDQTRDGLIRALRTFVQDPTRATQKYIVFFYIGHGGDGDILFMQDGSIVTTKDIDGIFAGLPSTVFRIFFIDACRGDGRTLGPGGYCPKYPNTIVSRSTLPHNVAWVGDAYGTRT